MFGFIVLLFMLFLQVGSDVIVAWDSYYIISSLYDTISTT